MGLFGLGGKAPTSASGDFEQQNQNEIAERLKLAMMNAKMQQGGGEEAPPPMSMSDTSAATTPTPTAAQTQALTPVPSSIEKAMATTPAQQPNIGLAHAAISDQPAAADVAKNQAALDAYDNRPTWRKILPGALATAASLMATRSYNGAEQQRDITSNFTKGVDQQREHRQQLIQQVQNAQGHQEQEYEADQRNRQQDLITSANNQNRSLMAQIAANSRQNVAQTAADSRETVADTNAGARRDVATTGANARVQASRYAADQAMTRLIYGQNRQDARQSRGIQAGFDRQQQGFDNTLAKPTADEDRRADLANAAKGYAEVLKDIMVRRPELFGPVAGRVTGIKNMVGTSDADVAELKYLKEQLGIVQMGAHSLRSAQAIAPIADSLVNSFNNSPEASIKVLEDAQKGLDMFTGPQTRPTVNNPRATPRKTPAKTGDDGVIVVTAEDMAKHKSKK